MTADWERARPASPDHGAGVARWRTDRRPHQWRSPRRVSSRVPARAGLALVRRRRHRARHRQASRRWPAVDRRALGGLPQRGSGAPERPAMSDDRRRLVARLRHLPDLSALVPGHAPATAAAISRASPRGCRMSPRSASTRSGCRPSSSRRWPTWATTFPTIAPSIRCSARSRISTRWSPRRTGSA